MTDDDDRIPTLAEARAAMSRPTFGELLARYAAGEDITDGREYVPPPRERKRNPPRDHLRRRKVVQPYNFEIDLFGEGEPARETPLPRRIGEPSRMPPRVKE